MIDASTGVLIMGGVATEQLDQSNQADSTERLLAEGGIGMGEVARRLGRSKGNKPVHPSTPARWARDGVRLPDGSRLHLESVTLPGGRLVTSWAAVLRFLRAQQALRKPSGGESIVRGPADRRRASERAGKELEAAGA